MLEIPGYTTGQQLQADSGTLLYRGRRVTDEQPVIIKTIAREFPTLRETLRLRNEYEIARSLHGINGIVAPLELENFGNGVALVLEDFGGVALGSFLKHNAGDLDFFFQVAISGTSTLAALHRQQVVHKDLRPDTILVHPDTKEVRITNFGIASRIAREDQAVSNPESLEGVLQYISPEQTGRMNRSIDFRSDFYSLGVLLYELLTGRPPFASLDPLELVHCHIAQRPRAPEDAGAPPALSRILLKLLAKTPEERYQSAAGILADLESCARHYEVAGELIQPDFVPGVNDVPAMFQIPQKLYGRDQEIQQLLSSFDRTAADGVPRLLLVAGYSGIGKSALVREIHKPLLERRGYYVAGKFDQNRRDVPCWAIVQALQEFIRQILTEREDRIQQWKQAMLESVGPNGQVIIEFIPELELIIGSQEPVDQLPPRESQNRFNTVFRSFVRTLSRVDQPLAIFLDDLQWADLASFELIKLLLTDTEIRSLFIIGAYRSNEVDPMHPLQLTLNELNTAHVGVAKIELEPLSENTIAEILTDALYCDHREALPLAALVRTKTDGNPFFMGEFLKSLYAEGLINLDETGRRWRWSLRRIREIDITENVVDLMTRRIQRLNDDAKTLLKLCACLGNRFEMRTLALVSGQTISTAARGLEAALNEGLILALDETYKYLAGYDDHATQDAVQNLQVGCKFSHDRVQQAAYSLISLEERERLHYEIGNCLLVNTRNLDEDVTDIVSHLNPGRRLATSDERRRLAELNLLAGLKAKNATAYDAAMRNFQIGIELLPDQVWEVEYELTLGLHENMLEAAYLTGDETLMDSTEAVIQNRARVVTDLVKTYEIRITYFTGKNQLMDAVHTALGFLRLLGVRLPKDPGQFHVYWSFFHTRLTRGRRPIASLIELPRCEDDRILAIQRICTIAVPPAVVAGTIWLYILAMINVRYSIRFGNSVDSSYCYGIYGFLQCSRLRDFERGFAFGELGFRIAEESENKSLLPKTLPALYYFIWHHKRHIREGMQPLLEAYKRSLENGDFEYVGWNTFFYSYASFASGVALHEMREIFSRFIDIQRKYNCIPAVNFMRPGAQIVANLLGESDNPLRLEGEIYSESEMLPELEVEHPSAAFHGHLAKNILLYLFGDFEGAAQAADRTSVFVTAVPAMPVEPLHFFYAALACFACCEHAKGWDRWRYEKKARRYAKILNKYARSCPANYLHKKLLLDAETARLSGKFENTLQLYEDAARHARNQGFIQEAAIAAERAGSYCLQKGFPALGRSYLQQALHDYERWGAKTKVRQLRETYKHLQENEHLTPHSGQVQPLESNPDDGDFSQTVDLNTLVEASQTISGEMVLEDLLKKMLVLVAENAGASRACLLLHQVDQDRWALRAAYNADVKSLEDSDEQRFTLWDDLPLEEGGGQMLAVAPVRYTIRTGQTLLLDNASATGDFTGDPFIARHRIPSILCLPLINQERIAGVLYLENSLAEGAFTAERTHLLSLLSTQMAISIENALSYENKRRVDELMELDRLKSELFANISHEFRTPLTLILSPINDLIAADASQQKLLHMIQRSAHSMLRLVNNLLDIARAEAGGMNLRRRLIQINDFVRTTTALFENPAANRDVILRIDVPDVPVYAEIDPGVMERVLLNLLSNALKYTVRGEITVRLHEGENDRLRITVQDSGKGIPPAILANVFQRFFSDEAAARSWTPGTGIGLSFAKEMVELHEGTLEVKSQEGVGSEFTIHLPVGFADTPQIDGTEILIRSGAKSGNDDIHDGNRYFREGLLIDLATGIKEDRRETRGRTEKGEQLLIVEDEIDLQSYLAGLFEDLYVVDTVDNLADALDKVRGRRPDLVLCDIMLAGDGDGYDFVRIVRTDPNIAETPIILLTARDDAESRLAGLSYGADDYITKPFHTDEVLLRVRNMLHRRRLHEHARSQTRDNLYSDLHDHLGSYLTDLKILTERLTAPASVKGPIQDSIRRAADSLSDALQHGEDLKTLGENFIDGLHLILLRRYNQSERALKFSADESARQAFRQIQGDILTTIYSAVQEMFANDIRYGSGAASWRFEAQADRVNVHVSSATDFDSVDGTIDQNRLLTIQNRLIALGGDYQEHVEDGTFFGVLEVPLFIHTEAHPRI